VQVGVAFRYTDRMSGSPRIGYFDPPTERFTAVTSDRQRILTHFPAGVDYVRNLPNSDYRQHLPG
jgi:hypothetical protein